MKEQIATNADNTHKRDDKEILNEIFVAKYTQEQSRENSLLQVGLRNAKQLLNNCTHASREDALIRFANKCLRDVRQERMSLVESKKKTDDALKILLAVYKEKRGHVSPEISILIAEAYYLASVAILPKGITIPEKKKEALKKGIEFIDPVIDQLKDSSPATVSNEKAPSQAKSGLSIGAESGEKAFRIKSLLSIERNRIDKRNCDDEELKDTLTDAVKHGCNKYNEREEDIRIAVRLCELREIDLIDPKNVINSPKADKLQRAKLHYFINKDNDNTRKYMKRCINSLEGTYLSHRLWDETVDFIERLRQDGNPLWKDFALGAYEACRKQEPNTDVFRLRWYWSRQRELYDMAFLAAKEQADREHDIKVKNDKIMKMAEISDSLKSRTSLRLSALQKIKGDDDRIRKFYDNIAKNYTNSYIKGPTGEVELSEEIGKKPPEKIDYTNVPKGWVVVHFYLNQLEGMGYAIFYNKDADTWQYKDFPYKELFNAFMTWQTNYSLYKEGAAKCLVELCRTIGKTMPFLFEDIFIPSNKNVLFVPHDFLHRLPLHGAIKKDTNEIFLLKHACCYLPAWSFAEGSRAVQDNADQNQAKQDHTEKINAESVHMEKSTVHKRVLLKNFEENFEDEDKNYFKDITPPAMSWDAYHRPAAPECLINKVNLPELLVILCHGEADMANPFRSRLKLTNGGITHLEILKSLKEKLKGTQIILGACETDLVPPFSDIIDEHTSVATAFLINKVRGILGTMWEVNPEIVEDMINEFLKKSKVPFLHNFIHTWQKEKFKILAKKPDNTTIFYDTIPFRTFADITTRVD